ncbi:MAG: fumarylacetoacetate hydrolase family protein [Akkermansiaceae bacterium]|nr:fumarylacetoacetate hydrolase family protein [Akkermansiaceae bacterium]
MNTSIYRTSKGIVARQSELCFFLPDTDWDALLIRENLQSYVEAAATTASHDEQAADALCHHLLAPISKQELWACGVTYYRSRDARMEESQDAGGGDFYDRVYAADRPELFFKATPLRVSHPGAPVRIRRDSTWDVPEPEFTLVLNPSGNIIGFTAGNDMSSRSIEGENPLYLPQAKTYDGCASVGPGILLTDELSSETGISLKIERDGLEVFAGDTQLGAMKRTPEELAGFLFRESSFPHGAFLMTGTGIIPGNDFTLHPGDLVHITIDGIGTLTNPVDRLPTT